MHLVVKYILLIILPSVHNTTNYEETLKIESDWSGQHSMRCQALLMRNRSFGTLLFLDSSLCRILGAEPNWTEVTVFTLIEGKKHQSVYQRYARRHKPVKWTLRHFRANRQYSSPSHSFVKFGLSDFSSQANDQRFEPWVQLSFHWACMFNYETAVHVEISTTALFLGMLELLKVPDCSWVVPYCSSMVYILYGTHPRILNRRSRV